MPIPEVDNAQVDGAEILRIDHDIDYTDPFLDKVDEVGEVNVAFYYLYKTKNNFYLIKEFEVIMLLNAYKYVSKSP